MIIIKASTNDTVKLFNLNGLDYAKGTYIIKYNNVKSDSIEDIRIAIVSKYNLNDYLVNYSPVESYNNGITNYSDVNTLVNDLSGLLGFNNGGSSSIPTEDIFHGGFVDYNDLGTSTTPIPFTNVGHIILTNDKLGSFTNETYLPNGITSIFSNNQFDFTQLKLGDMIDIRMDVTVTTNSPNQKINIDLALGIGAGEYIIPFEAIVKKTAGVHNINRFNGIYMGDSNTLDNPAEFRLSSDDSGTIVVNGWYCKIIRKGI